MVGERIDVQSIKSRVDLGDLAARDVRLRKVATTRGGEYAGPCPFCGGRDRFRVQPEKGLWFCRQGCSGGRWQDAIGFVMRRDSVGFAEACRTLGASASELGEGLHARAREYHPLFAPDVEPAATWRARAAALVESATATLWSEVGERARVYLAGRGLHDDTLHAWRIGFIQADHYELPADWGLSDADQRRVWLPRGIVIPWFIGEQLWQLKIRRASSDPKYWAVRGGHPLLYGADTLVRDQPAVMTEGEVDTMLVWQAVQDRSATVSLGSASRLPTQRAAVLLSQASPLLLAYDADAEGQRGAERLRQLIPRIQRIRPSVGKDIGEFVLAGGRPRAWITFELARLSGGFA